MAQVDTWARLITDSELYFEIPEDLRDIYEAEAGAGFNPAVYLIYCPVNERKRRPLSEKLLYILNDVLIYLEREREGIRRRSFAAGDIRVLETGFVLLDSWMVLAGKSGEELETVTIYYNRVVAGFFEELTRRMRMLALGYSDPPEYDNSLSQQMQKASYKYMNYTRNIIFVNEGFLKHAYQPLVMGRKFKIFRAAITNEHMLVLTREELIQLTEGRGFIDRYGRTNTFFFRRFIERAELSEIGETGRARLNVYSGGYVRSVIFDQTTKVTAADLISHVTPRRAS